MDIERTPDSAFDNLPGFDYEPKYRDWNGMRLAYIDEGEGEPVFLMHGEPTWGFLWRKVMGPLLDAGYRCIVPDLPGFGRSDKPTDLSSYTFDRMADSVATPAKGLPVAAILAVVAVIVGIAVVALVYSGRRRQSSTGGTSHGPLH